MCLFSGPLVKWLRHRPFTAVTWVRVPYGSPKTSAPPSGGADVFDYSVSTGLEPSGVRNVPPAFGSDSPLAIRRCNLPCAVLNCIIFLGKRRVHDRGLGRHPSGADRRRETPGLCLSAPAGDVRRRTAFPRAVYVRRAQCFLRFGRDLREKLGHGGVSGRTPRPADRGGCGMQPRSEQRPHLGIRALLPFFPLYR